MFENAKVGDKVWSFAHGFGKIIESYNITYPMLVRFENKTTSFTKDGKVYDDHKNPTLFWDEIKFEIPTKPEKLVKKYRWLVGDDFESSWVTEDYYANKKEIKSRHISKGIQKVKSTCCMMRIDQNKLDK